MKFPFILFFRYDKYKSIDTFLNDNCDKLNCTLHIINKKEKLNKLFKQIKYNEVSFYFIFSLR